MRSSTSRVLGGVCGGLAHDLGWNVWLVRALWLIVALIPVLPGLPVYVLLWIFLPVD